MSRFHDIPIRRKLTLIAMLTSGVPLLLACVAFVGYEHITSRQSLARDLDVIAQMAGYNSAASLSFEDVASAEQTLKSLVVQPHIIAACLYDPSGNIFARFIREGRTVHAWPKMNPPSRRFSADYLEVFRRIELGDGIAAAIYLRSDLAPLRARLQRYIAITIWVLLAATCAAYLIIMRLQRVISGPVAELEAIVDVVAREKNYAARAVKTSSDELGRLIDGFNNMLAQIQARDSELNATRTELEQRVEERTASLRRLQKEAQEKATELRFIFDALPVGVSWAHYEGDRIDHIVNQSFYRISGLNPGEPANADALRSVTHPDDLPRQTELWQKLDRGEIDTMALEKRYLHPNGDVIWVFMTMKVFRRRDGRILQRVTTIVDITERKRTEQELQQTHQRMMELSRQAGMAEVATGVLHNVGNVLNSVNVGATVVIDQIRRSQGANLEKLAALLAEHEGHLGEFFTHDPRGRRIPGYVALLDGELRNERASVSSELEQVRKHIEHIKDIVAMQQSYAKVSGVTESVPICELVEDALRMNAGALARHGLEVVREYHARPVVMVERHKVLQILVNLIGNAKYACDESGRPDKLIKVRIAAEGDRVAVAVIDNGIGIPAENLTRIFSHGFTTRKHGHGFGLHSGALAAKEMNGSLRVQSDGPGCGAAFILEIPLQPQVSHEPVS